MEQSSRDNNKPRVRRQRFVTDSREKMTHDPGGKMTFRLKDGVVGTAQFGGPKEEYRYRLTRTWDAKKPYAMWVLMNPSTATAKKDDPTVAKCRRFAEAWGYGGIAVANTFAYRCTDQKRLLEVTDPVGPENDAHIIEMAKNASIVVFAYGKPHRSLRSRGPALAKLLIEKARVKPHILGLTKDGTPRHPLYLKGTLTPIVWNL